MLHVLIIQCTLSRSSLELLLVSSSSHFLMCMEADCLIYVSGAAILWACTPEEWGLGVNGPVPADVPEFGAMMLELLATMVLVLVVYGTAVDKTNNSAPMLPCLLIGLTVSLAHFLLMPFSGKLLIHIVLF